MIRNSIINKFNSLNGVVSILRFVTVIIFLLITYGLIRATVDNFTARVYARARLINNAVHSMIGDSAQMIYGLALTLAQEPIKPENKFINVLLRNFATYNSYYRSIPFSGFKLIDKNNLVIERTLIPNELLVIKENTKDLAIVENSKYKPFDIQVALIRLSAILKEEIIPICMGFHDNSLRNVSTLCSGLIIHELNSKLKQDYSYEDLAEVALLNNDKKYNPEQHNKIIDSFSIQNLLTIFKYVRQNKYLTVFIPTDNYPFLIEMELRLDFLVKKIVELCLFCFGYFILFIIFSYSLAYIYKRVYKKPLYSMQRRLYQLPKNILTKKIMMLEPNEGKFSMQDLEKILNAIIEQFHIIEDESRREAYNKPITVLRNNILDLMLTERYKDISDKYSKVKFSSLCLGKLKQMLYEKPVVVNLLKFLEDMAAYCGDYYSDLKIEVMIEPKDYKAFSFYYTPLVEAIFNIFSLMIRVGKFENDNHHIIMKGEFIRESSFPTITIEAMICDSSLKPFGWESGPAYVYAGLFSIYLLAKENDLSFSIEQKGQKIYFILDKVHTKQLDRVNNILAPIN